MIDFKPFIRKVNYYETDAMGIVHHSNYIRWFEEARIDFMDKLGYGYAEVDEAGVDIAVLEVICKYIKAVSFGDAVEIVVKIIGLTPVKMRISYELKKIGECIVCTTGESVHCFLDKNRRVVRLNRVLPALYDLFKKAEDAVTL